ncbi:pyridoxal phosphate-dependent aminotransferase [Actinomycetes bacterium NPDC127524]
MIEFQKSELLKNLPQQFFASLVSKVNSITEQGHDVINLGQGNPDMPTPQHIIKKLQQAAENPVNHKYSPFKGLRSLKEAAAEFYEREYNVKLDPDSEVAILFGGKAGLVELPQCLMNPGDTALVPDPGYPDYMSGIAMAQAKIETLPLLQENGFLPDYDGIGQETLDLAKLMFINYPNNPTGAAATEDFFEKTVKLAKKHSICVVHDFAYGGIGFGGKKPLSFLQTQGAKDIGIEIYTLSKTYNMAGWRVGFAVGNPSVIEAIELIQDHMYVSLFPAVQEAAQEALLHSQECVKELVNIYESRKKAFIGGLRSIGWNVSSPDGSFFAWLKVPAGFTSQEFSDYLLQHAHVAVAAGAGFGEYGEGYVRAGLLTGEDRLLEAVRRIDALHLF